MRANHRPHTRITLDQGPMETKVVPIDEAMVPHVAAFLEAMPWLEGGPQPLPQVPRAEVSALALLEWFLRNPAQPPDRAIGHVMTDGDGRISGSHLCIAQRFAWGERRIRGSGSASFFASPGARRDGPGPAALFLEYLRLPGYDFRFSTTCNLDSGAFWVRLRAAPIRGSELEYLFPLRIAPLLEEVLVRKNAGRVPARMGGALASLGQPALDRKNRRAPFTIAPCTDWERLASLSEVCRDRERITSSRDSAYLAWRYGDCPGPSRVRVFRILERGNDVGWFALLEGRRGHGCRIRSAMLVDLVWPAQRGDVREALQTVIAASSPLFDVLSVRPRLGLGDAPLSLGARSRPLPGPTTYVYGRPDSPARHAERFDFVLADSDSAT